MSKRLSFVFGSLVVLTLLCALVVAPTVVSHWSHNSPVAIISHWSHSSPVAVISHWSHNSPVATISHF